MVREAGRGSPGEHCCLGLPARQPSAHQGRAKGEPKSGPRSTPRDRQPLGQGLVVRTWVVSIAMFGSRSRSLGRFTLGGSLTGRVGLAGVAVLPWTALIDHVGGTPSGRRENVEATSSGGPADGPIGAPPGVGNSHTVGIGFHRGCCRGEAAGLVGSAGVRPHGVPEEAVAPVRSLMLGESYKQSVISRLAPRMIPVRTSASCRPRAPTVSTHRQPVGRCRWTLPRPMKPVTPG